MTTQPSPSRGPSAAKVAVIRRLLEEQRSLLGQLDALSQRQGDLIDEEDSTRLLAVIAERQSVVDRLAEVSRRVSESRPEIDAVVGTLVSDTGESAEIRHLLQAVGDLAVAIQERDARDQERMRQRRDQLAAELSGLGASNRAVSAYGRKPVNPRYADQEA